MSKTTKTILWILRVAVAAIFVWTASGKLMWDPRVIEMFTNLGVEPRGRIGAGVVEIIAAILLLITPLARVGAVLAAATMVVAIVLHLWPLGINMMFYIAIGILIASVIILKKLCCCGKSCKKEDKIEVVEV